jgi:predicted TIM-barrel fold metal-dependent hydrolase
MSRIPGFDPDALTAIDMHVHVSIDSTGRTASPPELSEALAKYFQSTEKPRDVDATAAYYRERHMGAVVFTVDATTNLDHAPNSVDEIVEGAARNADVLIPFGSVDPLQGEAAVDEARRQASIGVRGFKFHPTVQAFDPSDPAHIPLFGAIEELGLPIVVHTGQTGAGAQLPGGYGFRLALSNPILLDDVAARHPELQIVMAHPSVPWQDEQLSVATHKGNVWIELSGWSAKYFAPTLVRAARTYLNVKTLFGSDLPALTPDRWLQDFDALDFPEAARQAIVKDNAVRLLGLTDA